jgi:hypothetical protein
MGVIANRFYNDPAMAQAASNLAELFAPPSGSDMSGFASARAKQQETDQRAALWRMAAGDPDRQAVIADLYDPSQSYYAVNQGNLTTRYGYDTAAATQRANNAADNARALKVAEEQSLLTPVAKDATRFVPPSIADAYGVDTTQAGNIGAAPGETIYKPGGGVVMGVPKPLTLDEWKAQEAAKAKAGGLISDQSIADLVLGSETPIQVLNADGTTSWMTPGEATRTGATPVPTMDQTKAIEAGKLNLSPDELKRLVLGDTAQVTPVKAVVDGKIVYMSPTEAIAKGAQAYVDPGSGDTLVKTVTPEGKVVYTPTTKAEGLQAYVDTGTPPKAEQGTAIIQGVSVPVWFNEDTHQWIRTDTQAPVPKGAQVTKMGQPQGALGDVTTGTNTDIQKNLIDLANAKKTTIALRDLVASSPASQGAVGWLRGTAQDIAQVGGEVAAYFGGPVAQAVDAAKADMQAQGVSDDLLKNFDDKVPRIEMIANLLAYQFAKINGDRLSNETVRENRKALGLENLGANQASTIARLNAAIQMIELQEGTLNEALTKGVGALATPAPPPPAATGITPPASAAAPAAPAAATAPKKEHWITDANGNLVPAK